MSGEILPGNAPCDNHRLRQIIIASYLHDMGKLMRRGGYERKTNLSFTLPTNDVIVGTLKSFSVAHAQHVLEYIFGLGVYQHNKGPKNNVFWQEIALISALHHEKDKTTYITQVTPTLHDAINIVYHADNMSSMERNKKDEDEEKNHHVKTTPMTSIFEVIFGQQEQGGHNQYVYNPHPLSNTTEPIFPSKHRTEVDFASLASGFLTGLDLLMQIGQNFSHHTPLSELDTRISQCDCLCQEYMTLVPSDAYTSNRADVSLYDHTKLVVANAVVLFHTTQTQKHDIKRGQPSATITANLPITLIGTDLPGIQGYLDQAMQTTKGLNKRLRARSLMIQMLNEAIVQFILHKLNLPRANVLINAGGQATIMSHQIDANDIADISDSINMFLLQNFGGYLRAVIGTFDTTMSQIYDKNIKKNDEDTHDTIQQAPFKKALIALKKNLTDGKHRISGKFADTLFDQDNPFRDRGINPSLWQNNADDTPSEGLEEGEINAMMQKERNLGQKIIGLHRGTLSLIYKNSEGQFAFERQDTQTQGSDNIFFLRFNKWWDENDCTKYVVPKSINVFVAKNNNNQVQDFETLASEDYLAYIKGDVDNMSLILGYGFDDDQTGIHNQYSVSRIVSFARLLEYFFGYRTHAFLEKNFAQTSYTVFSGGDDFELIVKYSDAIPLIQSYTKLFHDFVCHNPTIHFSLGMVLFKHKTPMHIVRKQAESCEKSAKKLGKDEMRNQFALFPEDRQTYLIHLNQQPSPIKRRTQDEKRKVLSHSGMTLFEPQFAFLGSQMGNERKNLGMFWSQRFFYSPDFLEKILIIEGLSHDVGGTFLYSLYYQFRIMYDLLDAGGSINFARYHHAGSKLIYSVTKKINDAPENKKPLYRHTLDRIKHILTIDITDNDRHIKTKNTLIHYLVSIIHELYTHRKSQ